MYITFHLYRICGLDSSALYLNKFLMNWSGFFLICYSMCIAIPAKILHKLKELMLKKFWQQNYANSLESLPHRKMKTHHCYNQTPVEVQLNGCKLCAQCVCNVNRLIALSTCLPFCHHVFIAVRRLSALSSKHVMH